MVTLNIANIPTPLYNSLLELKGKLHARSWIDVLMYAVQDPEGQIDFEVLKGGLIKCPSCGSPALNQQPTNVRLRFRTGTFIHDFDGSKPKSQQFNTTVSFERGYGRRLSPLEVRGYAKNR